MNLSLAYFAGVLRDGSIYFSTSKGRKYPRVAIYSNNKDFLTETIARILKEEFSAKFNITSFRNRNFRIETSDKKVLDFVSRRLNFPENRNQLYWKTPHEITSSNKEIQKYYIKGFFDAEGTVIVSDKVYNCCIRIYQSWNRYYYCPPLEDIKNMLKSFDVESSLVYANIPHGKKNKFPCYALILRRQNIIKFYELINSFHPDKSRKLLALYCFLKNRLQIAKMDGSKLATETPDYESNSVERRSVWAEASSQEDVDRIELKILLVVASKRG